MKFPKKVPNIFIVVLMITASIRTIPNITHFNEEIQKGVVFDTEYYSRPGLRGVEKYSILIKKNDKIYVHTTSEERYYEYNINDSVTYRILHNGGGIWILTKNNVKMNSYYQIYDFVMLSLFILLPIFYYLLNYKLKL